MTVGRRSGFVPALACAALILAAPAWSADEADPNQAAMAEMTAAYKAAGEPGAPHKFLERLAGRWSAKVKLWSGPGDPVEARGVALNEMILGGRFLRMEYKGEMMGETFVSLSLDGYDNTTKKYTGVWIDSMGTTMYTYEGECADPCMTRTMHTEYVDPATGKTVKGRTVTRLLAPNEFDYESWELYHEGEDVMAIHPVMHMALTYDHRVVDGVHANGFLYRIAEILEYGDFEL